MNGHVVYFEESTKMVVTIYASEKGGFYLGTVCIDVAKEEGV